MADMGLEIVDCPGRYLVHVELKTGRGVEKHGPGRSRQLPQKALVHLHHGSGQFTGTH